MQIRRHEYPQATRRDMRYICREILSTLTTAQQAHEAVIDDDDDDDDDCGFQADMITGRPYTTCTQH